MSEKRCFGCMLYKRNSPICEHCGYDERKTNAPHQLSPGTVLNNQYLVGKVLGQGGFGITYMGMDQFLDIPVAIKEFYPNGVVTRDITRSQSVFLTSDKVSQRFLTNRDRFVREAISLAKLGRSSGAANIVRVQNLVQANSTAYIIMEYVDGIDLRAYMARNGSILTLTETLRLLLPLMESLEVVHNNHIVHRDISPDNIMVLPDGSTKLIDFGAAHEVQYDGEGSQKSTEAILKYGFAPPEQYQRKGDLGPWTDVYALCATIYYCTTGKLPPNATDRLLGSEDFEWETIPGISPGMVETLQKGTAIRKDDRTQSMAALHQALAKEQQKAREIHRQISSPFSAHDFQLPQVAPEAPATAVSEQPPVHTVPLHPAQTPAFTARSQEEMTPATEFLADPELPSPTAPLEETMILSPTVPLEETMVLSPTVPLEEESTVPEEEPKAAEEEPEAPEEEPGAPEVEPEVTEEEPEAAEEEPEATEEEPEAAEEEPEVTEEEPEVTEEEPEVTEEEPEAAEEEPEVTEEEPEVTEEEPEVSGEEAEITGEEPEAIAEEPEVTEEEPEVIAKPEAPVHHRTPAEKAVSKPKRRPVWPKLLAAVFALALAALLGIKFLGSPDGSGMPHPAIPAPVTWTENVLMHTYGSEDQTFGDQNTPVFRSKILNSQVGTVTFMDTLAEEPQDSWDVSEAMDGSVKAWAVPNGDLYHLYIAAKGGISAGETCEKMFSSFENLQSVNFNSAFHTENTRSMASMFADCPRLTALDLSGLDTGNVTDMNHMFKNCKALENLNLMNLATGQVTDMQFMFFGCHSLRQLDLTAFDTANVTNMQNMFTGCSELTALDVSSFRTGNVSTMVSMFSGCGNLTQLDVSSFDTSHVMNMMQMFQDCGSLKQLDLSSFRTPNVTGMESMFAGCSNLTALDLTSFDTANVNSMIAMFSGCESLTALDLSSFQTRCARIMTNMFYRCSSLTELNLSSFDTSNVYNMESMFYGCSSLRSVDVSSFDTSHVGAMYSMFQGTTALGEVSMPNFQISGDLVIKGDAANFMDEMDTLNGQPWKESFQPYQYYGTGNTVVAIDAPVVTSEEWKGNVLMLTYGDTFSMPIHRSLAAKPVFASSIPNNKIRSVTFLDTLAREPEDSWDVSLEKNGTVKAWAKPNGSLYDLYIAAEGGINGREAAHGLFSNCVNLEKVDFGKAFHTDEATDMTAMFYGCEKLTTLNLRNWNTANVTNMTSAFEGCAGLTSLDLSKWDTGNVIHMASMFSGCESLTALDVSGFDTARVTDMNTMFARCGNLPVLDVSKFNTAQVTDMSGMFSGCASLTELDVTRFNTAQVTDMDSMFSGCASLMELDVTRFNTAQVTDMDSMFSGCASLTELDVTRFNTAHVRSMAYMFKDCARLESLDVRRFNTYYTMSTEGMFSGCSSLTELDVSRFHSGGVAHMFENCSSLINLKIRGMQMSGSMLQSTERMFAGCSSLTAVDLGTAAFVGVLRMNDMFSGCTSLESVNLSGIHTTAVQNMSGMFFGCESLTALDLSMIQMNVKEVRDMFFGTTALSELYMPEFPFAKIKDGGAVNFMDEGDTFNGKPWKSYFTPEQYTEN